MKSFVINFPGETEPNTLPQSMFENVIIDNCTIKGEVKTNTDNLLDAEYTSVTLEISSLLPDGTNLEWGTLPTLSTEVTTTDDGRKVVIISLAGRA